METIPLSKQINAEAMLTCIPYHNHIHNAGIYKCNSAGSLLSLALDKYTGK